MSTAGSGPESVGPFPRVWGVQRHPLSQCRTGERERGEEPKVASAARSRKSGCIQGRGRPRGSPLRGARSRGRTDTRPLLLTSKLSATVSSLPFSALTHVLSFRMGDSVPSPSSHATLFLSSFYLGPAPPTPTPASPPSPLDGQLASSCRVDGGVGSPKPKVPLSRLCPNQGWARVQEAERSREEKALPGFCLRGGPQAGCPPRCPFAAPHVPYLRHAGG